MEKLKQIKKWNIAHINRGANRAAFYLGRWAGLIHNNGGYPVIHDPATELTWIVDNFYSAFNENVFSLDHQKKKKIPGRFWNELEITFSIHLFSRGTVLLQIT